MKHRDKSDAFAEQTSALEHGNNPGSERDRPVGWMHRWKRWVRPGHQMERVKTPQHLAR